MAQLTFDDIRNRGLLLYEYVRGSHAYGLQKPDGTSDVDTGGIFIEPQEWLNGLGVDYCDEITDERADTKWYSLRKFMNLLLNANPNVLEALYVPDRCVIYEHPLMTEIKKNRDIFLTKDCFKSFLSFATSQIRKARGLNKKIVNPMTERLAPLDFVYTFYKQGSTKISNWLQYRGLKQQYCGLVHIPNMQGVYGVYYDWGNHFKHEALRWDILEVAMYTDSSIKDTDWVSIMKNWDNPMNERMLAKSRYNTVQLLNMLDFIMDTYSNSDDFDLHKWYLQQKPIGYSGIVNQDQTSNELRLSSVSKGEKPICYIAYNQNGYSQHCREWKEYQEWVKKRNPERFKENQDKEFDRKNIAHSVRLLHMGIEIAKTGQMLVDRTDIDRDFIMGIRLGDTSYDEIIKYLDSKKEELEDAVKNSTLPDSIDVQTVNKLLLDIRKKFNKQVL